MWPMRRGSRSLSAVSPRRFPLAPPSADCARPWSAGAPWWLSLEWGDPAKGAYANANAGVIPRGVYDRWSAETQLLFRHRAEGVRDQLQYPLQLMSAKVDNMRQSRREEMKRARERGEEPAGNEGVVVQPYRLPKL